MTPKEFFDKYVVVDYHSVRRGILLPGEEEPGYAFIFTLSPAIVGSETGKEAPFDMMGRCVFYTADKMCAIHAAKPDECRYYNHDTRNDEIGRFKLQMVEEWKRNQDEIKDLLGRDPVHTEPDFAEMLKFGMKAKMEELRQLLGFSKKG
jgi:Fe-S-cluster containining protein